ncbi:MAG: SDR family oxidoreductase [Acidobacteriota bacterium]|nr:SDR family oxidoreductase [Acidobacteriota bacterium]
MSTVLVTGGAGYVGCVLVPKLLAGDHRVVALDSLWFGDEGLRGAASSDLLEIVPGDIRDGDLVAEVLRLSAPDVVIHLAAVSNDPCSDIDPALTKSINLDATSELMRAAKRHGVARFLNASSASVYGIKEEAEVTEDLPLEPLTLYARYKAETEEVLNGLVDDSFCGFSLRAATVCGYSPRLRLDLTINILTYHAVTKGRIRVFGGAQQRPNVHIQDLTDLYARLVAIEPEAINGKALNVATSNSSVLDLAYMIRDEISPALPIDIVPTEDERSYRLSAERARREVGFVPRHELAEAVRELAERFRDGTIADPDDYRYRNIEVMKRHPEILETPCRRAG